MVWHPTKEAVQRLWGRRWVRRVSYVLVAGTTAFLVTPWVASRPAVLRWATRRLDALVREETGLSLAIGAMEFHPGLGMAALQNVRLGDDLLTIKRVEVHLDFWSLLGPTKRIYSVRLERPHLRLTEAGFASIKLKEHPPRSGPLPRIQLDYVSLTGGEIEVPKPVRGIPALTYHFEVKGSGLGPNQLRVDLTGAQLNVLSPTGWERGRLDLNGDLSETTQILREGYLRLGETQLRLHGRFVAGPAKEAARVEARLSGVLDLAQAAHWGGQKKAPLEGDLEIAATLQGPLAKPAWTLSAEGQELRPAAAAFVPGNLELKGSGSLDHARLERFRWASSQGEWEAEGAWSKKAPIEARLHGAGLDLEAVGQALHVQELAGVRGALEIQVKGPHPHQDMDRPDHWQASAQATLSQHDLEAGSLQATLAQGRIQVDQVRLDLEALKLEGSGQASLDARGLRQLDAKGRVAVGAEQVAQALRTWKVVDLDMEGAADASAQVRWSRGSGLELDGSVAVAHPRWHGARADRVFAKSVEIRGSDLRIKDIDLEKDQGHGGGDLWLTWAKVPPGQLQMDMCYSAFRLPVREGLRAADLKDDEGNDLPITGTGSGWVRLWGPFDHLLMTGSAQVESGETYGVKIPAASGDFWMDLDTLHMRVSDVRLAERPDLLGRGDLPPEGALALAGRADMDFRRWTWWVEMGGRVDSQLLALPGPRFQAQTQVRLLGPITSPFGSVQLPEGQAQWSRGRLFFGNRSVEGLEGRVSLEQGRLAGRVGMEGMAHQLLDVQVRPEGEDLVGRLNLAVTPDSAHTGLLAQGLTDDLLEDLTLAATAQGRWKGGQDLTWTGSLDRLSAQFSAFELHQSAPSALKGNAEGAHLELSLEGGARAASAETAPKTAAKAAHLQVSGTLPFSGSGALGLRTQGEADLAHVKSILDRVLEVDEYSLLSDLSVQGTSRFSLLAHGTYFDPLLDGTLALDRGRMNLRGYQGAEDIRGEAILKGRTLTISEEHPLQGTLAHGALNASGALLWRPGGLDSYAFKASLSNFQLRDVPDGLDLQGDLQATFTGTEEGGLLKGSLSADRLSYQTEVKLSDLILRSALSDSGTLTGLDLDDPLERIRLDLDLELRAPWRFDTNLLKLDGRTEGPFQIVGTLGHPVPKGTMVFQPGGRVTNIFPAGDMVVDRGSLTFSEVRPLDPMIALQGSVTSIPGYTVNMDVRGTMSKLSVIPSSTPSLRQDEIMAILINPGNVNNVGTAGATSSASQGAITSGLASAGSGLITTLAFAPLQEQLRRSLGLDRVNVSVRTTSLGGNEAELTLGRSSTLFGQRSAGVFSYKKSGELSISSLQMELRFGDYVLQVGLSKGGGASISPSGEIRHTWSPK